MGTVLTVYDCLLTVYDYGNSIWLFTDINGCCAGCMRMYVPRYCLWVIWMAIIRSGWVLQRLIVKMLWPLTSRLCPVVISWLSARPMHVEEYLTSWWLMSWPYLGCCCRTHLELVGLLLYLGCCCRTHSSLSAIISTAQAVPNLCGSRKVFLKY